MPSQLVLDALDKLHRELLQLEPAVNHIKAAQNVTTQIQALPPLHVKFLNELKEEDDLHKIELREIFKDELEKLSENHKVLTAFSENLHSKVNDKIEHITQLIAVIKSFQDKVDIIDFPERLSTIENTVKDSVVQIEESRKVMVTEVGHLNDQIGEVNFQDDFRQLKDIVRSSADDNAKYIQVFKAEDIGKKIDAACNKISGLQNSIDSSKSSLAEHISTVTEKAKVSIHNKVEKFAADFNNIDFVDKFKAVEEGINSVHKNQTEWVATFLKIELNERLQALENTLLHQGEQLDALLETLNENDKALHSKLDRNNKHSVDRHNIVLAILILCLVAIIGGYFVR